MVAVVKVLGFLNNVHVTQICTDGPLDRIWRKR